MAWPTPQVAAAAFLEAMRAGDDLALWELLSAEAQRFVIDRAVRRGLSAEVADSLLADDADPDVFRGFVADVFAGVTKDLEGVRLDRVGLDESHAANGKVTVTLVESFATGPGAPLPPLPVASLVFAPAGDGWMVERLVPRPG